MNYAELREAYRHLEESLQPRWIEELVYRSEADAVGSAIIDRRALLGSEFGQLPTERFRHPEFRAAIRAMRLAPAATDRAILAATKHQCQAWNPGTIYTAIEQAIHWHSEYYAVRLRRAWKLQERHRVALRTIAAINESEGKYRWS